MLTVAIPKRNKLQNIIVLTPKDGAAGIYIVCAHKTSPLPLNFYTVIII